MFCVKEVIHMSCTYEYFDSFYEKECHVYTSVLLNKKYRQKNFNIDTDDNLKKSNYLNPPLTLGNDEGTLDPPEAILQLCSTKWANAASSASSLAPSARKNRVR